MKPFYKKHILLAVPSFLIYLVYCLTLSLLDSIYLSTTKIKNKLSITFNFNTDNNLALSLKKTNLKVEIKSKIKGKIKYFIEAIFKFSIITLISVLLSTIIAHKLDKFIILQPIYPIIYDLNLIDHYVEVNCPIGEYDIFFKLEIYKEQFINNDLVSFNIDYLFVNDCKDYDKNFDKNYDKPASIMISGNKLELAYSKNNFFKCEKKITRNPYYFEYDKFRRSSNNCSKLSSGGSSYDLKIRIFENIFIKSFKIVFVSSRNFYVGVLILIFKYIFLFSIWSVLLAIIAIFLYYKYQFI